MLLQQPGASPFDPVSVGLAWLLVRWRVWAWSDLLTELHSRERGLGYCQRLGFSPDDLPAESTFRIALTKTEDARLRQCADSLILDMTTRAIPCACTATASRSTATTINAGTAELLGESQYVPGPPGREALLLVRPSQQCQGLDHRQHPDLRAE
jgi:hypothetical protein